MGTLQPGSLDVWYERSSNEEEFFRMRIALGDISHDQVVDREELNRLLEEYPQWTIQYEASAGKIVKTYRRDLSDMPYSKSAKVGNNGYYDKLFEPELFDPTISTILGGVGSGSSMLGCFVVVVYDSEPSIVASDILKIADTEHYLHNAGYIPEPQQDVV